MTTRSGRCPVSGNGEIHARQTSRDLARDAALSWAKRASRPALCVRRRAPVLLDRAFIRPSMACMTTWPRMTKRRASDRLAGGLADAGRPFAAPPAIRPGSAGKWHCGRGESAQAGFRLTGTAPGAKRPNTLARSNKYSDQGHGGRAARYRHAALLPKPPSTFCGSARRGRALLPLCRLRGDAQPLDQSARAAGRASIAIAAFRDVPARRPLSPLARPATHPVAPKMIRARRWRNTTLR